MLSLCPRLLSAITTLCLAFASLAPVAAIGDEPVTAGASDIESRLAAYKEAYSQCKADESTGAQWIGALAGAVDAILADPNHPKLVDMEADGVRTAPVRMLELGEMYVGRFDDMTSSEFYDAQRRELGRLLEGEIPQQLERQARFNLYFLSLREWSSTSRAQGKSGAVSRDDCQRLADDYYRRYPDEGHYGPTLHWWPSSATSDLEEVEKTVALMRERYPGARLTKTAEGRLRTVRMLAQPFHMDFTDLLSGEQVTLPDDYRGKVVLVDFWATWCGPCVGKMPHIKSDLEKYKEQGFAAIGVTVDEPDDETAEALVAKREQVTEFLTKNGYDWPQQFRGVDAAKQARHEYGVSGYPTVYLLDREGRLRWSNRAFVDADGKLVSSAMPEEVAVKMLLEE